MRVQYCSDLHLEFEQNERHLREKPLKVSGDVLVLAGDVAPLEEKYFQLPFFGFCADNYQQVYWIPGNHEFYHQNLAAYPTTYNIKLKSNLSLVNNVSVLHDGVNFAFTTLWSKISGVKNRDIEQRVADFECINLNNKKLRIADFNALHTASMAFLTDTLKGQSRKTVVVTHHLPSPQCNFPAHNFSPINDAFCVDITEFVAQSQANFWIYGHSHFNQLPLVIGKTMLLTNQLGYLALHEHKHFKRNAYFAV